MKQKKNKKKSVQQIFDRLEREAQRDRKRARKIRPHFAPDKREVVGVLQGSGRGYAFLRCEGVEQDMFVPARNLHGAMHGDTVRAVEIEKGKAGRGGVAEVTAVLERGASTFVGRIVGVGAFYQIVPDDRRITDAADVPLANLAGATHNDKVVAAFVTYGEDGNTPIARVVEVLGDADEVGVDVLSIIRSYELYEEFPREVEDEAHAAPSEVDSREAARREDFRADTIITIDGEDAKDLDDAIGLVKTEDGFVLSVHIADVSHYVTAGSAIDREAYRRGTSAYFPELVLPMLPRELSNGICSLNEGVDRLTLSCIMEFDAQGVRKSARVVKGVIRTAHRMTYTAVQAILDGDESVREQYADVTGLIANMSELTELLLARRTARGAVDFALVEPKILIDKHTGKITDIVAYPRLLAHRMIEEFMLAANEAVAHKFLKLDVPFVYRVHETPSGEKIEALREFLAGFNLKLESHGDEVQPSDVQKLLSGVAGKPCESVVTRVALRAMQKAKYSECCLGHFGLAAQYYCHFTSPIRRYPDLTIHRIIGEYLDGGKAATNKFKEFVAVSAEQSSMRERMAEYAERDVDDLKKAEYMADRIGEVYTGRISGVTPFGLFVELENTIEGLLRIELLPDEAYECDEVHYVLKGTSNVYRLGDEIRVKVAAASKESRRIDFCLEDEPLDIGAKVPEIRKMVMPGEREDRYGAVYRQDKPSVTPHKKRR